MYSCQPSSTVQSGPLVVSISMSVLQKMNFIMTHWTLEHISPLVTNMGKECLQSRYGAVSEVET